MICRRWTRWRKGRRPLRYPGGTQVGLKGLSGTHIVYAVVAT